MEIRALTSHDVERWIGMRLRLWPENDRDGLTDEITSWKLGKTGVFVADADGALVGFSEVSMHDRADGCSSSPVGYLEAWWVDEGFRRTGIGTRLLAAAEAWAGAHGATEMASDTYADNGISRIAHRALGFAERRPVVGFHKSIAEEAVTSTGRDRSNTDSESSTPARGATAVW